MDWSKLSATQAFQSKIRSQLLGLSGVTTGRRFGGEAFFFRKRFFCHFHPSKDYFFLETFVWGNVNEVVRDVPGVIPHPEYGGYGWVRLPIKSEEDKDTAERLISITYKYLRTTKRISLPKASFRPDAVDAVKEKLPGLKFSLKESTKRIQVLVEASNVKDYGKADLALTEATNTLRKLVKPA